MLTPNARLTDGVPTMVPESLGYHHQYVCSMSQQGPKDGDSHVTSACEYWQFEEPREVSSPNFAGNEKPPLSQERIL